MENIMNKTKLMPVLTMLLILYSCNNTPKKDVANRDSLGEREQEIIPIVQEVLTKEQRDALTPERVILNFKEGNARFIKNDLTARDHSAQVRKSANGQFPKAVVISCVDSRVPVEDIFDRGIGDIFVGRVAGNFINVDLLGSLEFACKVAGSKLIVVMGHEHCGAIKAAIDNVKLGNITAMLSKILPAIDKVDYDGDRTSKNEKFVHKVCKSNVKHAIEQIRLNSPILEEMENNGEIKIVGATYDMDSGMVTFLE